MKRLHCDESVTSRSNLQMHPSTEALLAIETVCN